MSVPFIIRELGRAAEVSRIELLSLQTVTVTEEQFLAGPVGYDARARAKTVEDVKALLRRVFKLEPAR